MANLDLAREVVAAVMPRSFAAFDDRAEGLLEEALARLDLEALDAELTSEDCQRALAVIRRTLLEEGYGRAGRDVDAEEALRNSGRAIARDETISAAAREAISRDCLYCYVGSTAGAG